MRRRLPTSPVAIGWLLFRAWRRLPPKQRQQLLRAARTHGPRLASAAAAATTARAARKRP
jgi:hypothetical protein